LFRWGLGPFDVRNSVVADSSQSKVSCQVPRTHQSADFIRLPLIIDHWSCCISRAPVSPGCVVHLRSNLGHLRMHFCTSLLILYNCTYTRGGNKQHLRPGSDKSLDQRGYGRSTKNNHMMLPGLRVSNASPWCQRLWTALPYDCMHVWESTCILRPVYNRV
jgi:hypothetical protein